MKSVAVWMVGGGSLIVPRRIIRPIPAQSACEENGRSRDHVQDQDCSIYFVSFSLAILEMTLDGYPHCAQLQRHCVEDIWHGRLSTLANMLLFVLMTDITGSSLMNFIIKSSLIS